MTFFPLAYVGIGPQIPGTNVGFPLGWQGIIPFKAEKMARMAVKLMTEQLIDVKEEFSKLDVNRVATEIDGVVLEKLQSVIKNTFERHQEDVWKLLPDEVRDELVVKGGEAGPKVISTIMTEVKEVRIYEGLRTDGAKLQQSIIPPFYIINPRMSSFHSSLRSSLLAPPRS